MTSTDARPWPLENKALTTAVSSSSICIPRGRGAGGERGIGDLGLRHLGAGGVGGMCGERGCIRECAGARGRKLQPGPFSGACWDWRYPFAQTFGRGINLVVSSLATVPYPPLHEGAAQARWQPVRLANLGQWPAVHIPWRVVAFGIARRRQQAESFTRDTWR